MYKQLILTIKSFCQKFFITIILITVTDLFACDDHIIHCKNGKTTFVNMHYDARKASCVPMLENCGQPLSKALDYCNAEGGGFNRSEIPRAPIDVINTFWLGG